MYYLVHCLIVQVLFAFQRMTKVLGMEVLGYLQLLIENGLIARASCKEVIDFINFVGLILFKFKVRPSLLIDAYSFAAFRFSALLFA